MQRSTRITLISLLALVAILAAACAPAAAPAAPQVVTKEVIVTKEVPKEVIVTKEVVVQPTVDPNAPKPMAAGSVQLNGAGATFPDPIYTEWRFAYQYVDPSVVINY